MASEEAAGVRSKKRKASNVDYEKEEEKKPSKRSNTPKQPPSPVMAVHFYNQRSLCSNLEKVCIPSLFNGYNLSRGSGHTGSGMYFVVEGSVTDPAGHTHELRAPAHNPAHGQMFRVPYPWHNPFIIYQDGQEYALEKASKLLLALTMLTMLRNNNASAHWKEKAREYIWNVEKSEDLQPGTLIEEEPEEPSEDGYSSDMEAKSEAESEAKSDEAESESESDDPGVKEEAIVENLEAKLREAGIPGEDLEMSVHDAIAAFWASNEENRDQPMTLLLQAAGYDGVVNVLHNNLRYGSVYFNAPRFLQGLKGKCSDNNADYCTYTPP